MPIKCNCRKKPYFMYGNNSKLEKRNRMMSIILCVVLLSVWFSGRRHTFPGNMADLYPTTRLHLREDGTLHARHSEGLREPQIRAETQCFVPEEFFRGSLYEATRLRTFVLNFACTYPNSYKYKCFLGQIPSTFAPLRWGNE